MQSEYITDQGKRTQLLEYLASMYEVVADLSGVLLTLDHGGLDAGFVTTLHRRACTLAMDLQADWQGVCPMLTDMYGDSCAIDAGLKQ